MNWEGRGDNVFWDQSAAGVCPVEDLGQGGHSVLARKEGKSVGAIGGQALGTCLGHVSYFQVPIPHSGAVGRTPDLRVGVPSVWFIAGGGHVGLHRPSPRHMPGCWMLVSELPLPCRTRKTS